MDILWVGVAFICGMLVSRIKLPTLVGYLAAGAALAAYGYEAGAALQEVAHLGVLFLADIMVAYWPARPDQRYGAFSLEPGPAWTAASTTGYHKSGED